MLWNMSKHFFPTASYLVNPVNYKIFETNNEKIIFVFPISTSLA